MPVVRTVLGDIDAGRLGICYAHEHLLIIGGMPVLLDSDFLLNDPSRAAQDLAAFVGAGGRAVIDMMPPGLGRDAEGLSKLSDATGVSIVAATGFHIERYYDSQHWLFQYSSEQIADLFRAEIEEGMDQWGYRGPLVRRTESKAGVLKVATGYYRWNKNTDTWFEAAAMAQRSTGVPISSHTEMGVLGDRQVERLVSLGVPASSIIVGHMDKNPDPYVHRDLAARGVFLEYDGLARQKYGPDSDTIRLISYAVQHGYQRQILLGMDLARRSSYPSYEGGPGLRYLLDTVVPRLRAEGLTEVVPLLFVENPARAFSFP